MTMADAGCCIVSATESFASSGSATAKDRPRLLRLVVVSIAGLRSSFAGGGGACPDFGVSAVWTPLAAFTFRTIAVPTIATAFRFLAGRLGR